MQNSIKSAFESMLLNTGAFFRRQQWKEIIIFIFFLLLSFGFWLLQSLQRDYERRIELPLRYKNVPSEWILSGSNPDTINILLKDKGTTLFYYSWKANFNPVDISVTGLPRLSEHVLHVSGSVIETAVSKQLISSTSVISIEPHEFELRYDTLSSRLVPVAGNVKISTMQGFQISGDIKVSHPEVRIYGRSNVVDYLKEVKTKLVSLENLSGTKEVTAQLDLPEGVKTDHETVKLTIPVEEFTEKKIKLPILCPDIPNNYVLRMFPASVEVICNIPVSQFRELTADKLEIIIPFEEFKQSQNTGKMLVRLIDKPSWVINYSVVPNELEFIIEYLK